MTPDEIETDRRMRQLIRAGELLAAADRLLSRTLCARTPDRETCLQVEMICRKAYFGLSDLLAPADTRPAEPVTVPTEARK